ncbi:MAG TPA: hypothetical protein VK446_17010 [Methylocystis sp.]|nr:hypothetical protein [Methylocystis sp.]
MERRQCNRRLLWGAAAALAIVGAAALRDIGGAQKISLSEAQIQERLNSRLDHELPISGAAARFVKSARAESAQVRILNKEVGLTARVAGKLRNDGDFSFTVAAIGAPRYDDGAFYFDPQKIEMKDLALAGVAGSGSAPGRRRILGELAQRLVEENATLVEEWAAPLADGIARRMLARRPVYRVADDFKGRLIKTSLDSVEVVDGRIDLTFTILGLGFWAIVGAACVVLALVLALWLLLSAPSQQR